MNTRVIHNKVFEPFIDEEEIKAKVKELGKQIENDNRDRNLLFISILNGSYVFTADLLREIDLDINVSFLKLASYEGLKSTGKVKRLIGLSDDLSGKTVIIVEDIVDTGKTLDQVIEDLRKQGAAEIRVVSLLVKPEVYRGSHEIDYKGFEIPNDFVIGYGLDFDGLGRNLRSIYRTRD